jgi:hypothetical protein
MGAVKMDVHLSMKQGNLFLSSCNLPNHNISFYALGRLWRVRLLMSMGAFTWFEIVWNYNVEAINY